MDLSQIDIQLEKRSNAEAVQLGFVIARRYFMSLAIASLLPMLPFILLGTLLVLVGQPIWASILVWWLKPFYDRVILFNLSRLIFSEKRDFWQILASCKAVLGKGLWLNLSFFRFSPIRGVSMCIQLLEGLSGNAYRRRCNYIVMTIGGAATAVWVGLVHFEFFLSLNLVLLFDWGDERMSILEYFFSGYEREPNLLLEWLLFICYAVAVWLIEIFYVATTFMLYINRRIELEGWDIEIAFKKMAEKYAGLAKKTFVFAIVMVGAMLLTLPQSSYAEAVIIDNQQNKEQLQQIIDREDPPPYQQQKQWQLKKQETKDRDREDLDWDGSKDLSFIGVLLKGAALIFLAWLIYLLYRSRETWMGMFTGNSKAKVTKAPSMVMGMQVTKESLPDDIIAEVRRLIAKGQLTEALSLLYRGTLSDLIYSFEIDIHESYTEGDCLRIARKKIAPAAYAYFSQLTKQWQQMVYAHQAVTEEALVGLSNEWNRYFSAPKDQQAGTI